MSLPTDRRDPPRVLHGRTAECAHLDALLADARTGRSGALVIRGEAGIGKSALIAHARAQATDMTVLAVTGNEFDVEVSYAGLFDLLRPTLEVIDELPQPQRDALHSAFAMGSPTTGSRFGVAIGVLGHLSHLAGRQPLLITVDDGQWLDAASVEAIAFVARRVAAEGIVVLVAERSGADGVPSLYGGLPTLTLTGLDDEGVAALLADEGKADGDVGHFRRLTAGNPLVIRELARGGSTAHADDEEPVPATEAIRATFLAQVAPLSERCRQALVYVAAAGQNDVPVLPAVLTAGGLAITDLDEAEAAGLLALDAGRVTFRHPLVRSAIYHGAPPAVRRAVHVSFAEALADLSAPAHAERRVAHLAMAGDLPDESLAAEMEQVGHAAAARSSYATAAKMLERSALLSTDTDRRARRYLAAASSALPAGQLSDLARLVEATFAWASDDRTRMAASHLAYRASLWQGVPDTVHRYLAEGALTQSDPADAAVILAEAGLAALLRGDRAAAVRDADRAIELARDLPGPVQMPGLIVRATLHAMALQHDRARALLQQAAPWIAARPGEQWPLIAPMLAFLLDDLGVAAQGLELVISAMRRFGVIDLLPTPLLLQSRLDLRRGDWARSRIAAHEAYSLVSSLGGSASETGSVLEPDCMAAMAVLEAVTGDAEACKRHARMCLAFGTAHGVDFMIGHGRRAFGLLALGAGDFEAAAMQFQELDDMASSYGLSDTPMLPWLADLAEAELATDNRAAATATIQRMAEHAATVGTPASQGLLLRCSALAGGEPDAEALEESAGLLRRAGVPFESARSRLHAGQVHRRRKQLAQARQQLISAFDAFDALGAVPWRDRTGAELRASGATVPDQAPLAADLTPQELQVVRLAADGESNAQIAMTLFLSKKTVEFHLGKAFRKLGVNRRSQLAKIPGVAALGAH